MTPRLFVTLALTAVVVLAAAPARAQQSGASGGLHVTPLESGFVIAPDIRLTTINDRSATLAGAYGGYEVDRTFFVGAAAYWLANRDDDFKTQYAGGLVRWTVGGHRAVGVSTGAFVGLGSATLSRTYADLFGEPVVAAANTRPGQAGRGTIGVPSRINGASLLRIKDDFVVAEPQVNLLLRLVPWMRLDVGAGYRFVGASNLLERQLRGASGSIALRFGGN